jgi:hypothetical protein
MMRKTYCYVFFSACALGYCAAARAQLAQSPPPTAEIRGVLRLQKNKPISGALVTASPVPPAEGSRPATKVSVLTDKDGAFRITGLGGGAYRLCVMSPKDDVLDPCEWSATPLTVTLKAGALVDNVDLAVKKGKILKIRIDDADRAVPTPSQPRPDAFLQLGVKTPDGVLHRGRFLSSDRQGHNYVVLVDPSAKLKLAVDSYNCDVTDDNDKKMGPDSAADVKSDDASLDKGFHFKAAKPKKNP